MSKVPHGSAAGIKALGRHIPVTQPALQPQGVTNTYLNHLAGFTALPEIPVMDATCSLTSVSLPAAFIRMTKKQLLELAQPNGTRSMKQPLKGTENAPHSSALITPHRRQEQIHLCTHLLVDLLFPLTAAGMWHHSRKPSITEN